MNSNNILKPRFLVLSAFVLMAALTRLIPHPPNFAPIGALALFGGAFFLNKKHAFIIPVAAMLISDLFIGFHALMPFVYGSFVLIVLLGFRLRENKKVLPVTLSALAASVIFFIISNLGVWLAGSFYPKNLIGLTECYIAAIPFFHNTLLSDILYTAVLFCGFAFTQRQFPVLAESKLNN